MNLSSIITGNSFSHKELCFNDIKTYLFSIFFIAGNILFPFIAHSYPSGGKIFLPIYFFTLIGAYKFGWKVGFATAFLSPIINNLLTTMPPASILPIILIKAGLLAFFACIVAKKSLKISILHILVVVVAYQAIGSIIEAIMTGSLKLALQDVTLGIPGLLIQVILGFIFLIVLDKIYKKRI